MHSSASPRLAAVLLLALACGATPASKLLGFANMFDERGFIGDVCADDSSPFFSEALPVIGDACLGWIPPN